MGNEEFKIARQLIRGRSLRRRRQIDTETALKPAVFREIDGGELARQYVNHRSLMGAEIPSRVPGEREKSLAEELGRTPVRTPPGLLRDLSLWMRRIWRS